MLITHKPPASITNEYRWPLMEQGQKVIRARAIACIYNTVNASTETQQLNR